MGGAGFADVDFVKEVRDYSRIYRVISSTIPYI